MSPQTARLPQRSPPTSFPCPTLALRAFLATQRSRRGAFFALLRPFGCGAIRPWLRIAVRARIGAASSERATPWTKKSPPCPSGRSLRITKSNRLGRTFSMNWLCMATAPWTTSLIRVPCPLRMPRLLRSNPPSTLCPASFSTPRLEADLPTSCDPSSISSIARPSALNANSTTMKPRNGLAGRTRRLGNPDRSNWSD